MTEDTHRRTCILLGKVLLAQEINTRVTAQVGVQIAAAAFAEIVPLIAVTATACAALESSDTTGVIEDGVRLQRAMLAQLANDMDAYRSASQGTVDAMAQGAASGDEDDRIIRLLAQRVMQQLLDREA